MKDASRLEVAPEELRWTLDPDALGIASTDEATPCRLTPGQHRAVRALDLGLGLRSRGYNVFLSGEAGTHRSETLERLLDDRDDSGFQADDFAYVHDFKNPDQPRLLRFSAGEGVRFREAMVEAVNRLRAGIPRLLGGEVYAKRRKARIKRFTNRLETLAEPLKRKAEPIGLSLVQVQAGEHSEAELLPVIDDEPVAFEDLEVLVERGDFPKAELQALVQGRESLLPDLRSFSEAADRLAVEATRDLAALDREMTRPYLNLVLSQVHQTFPKVEGAVEYLREVEAFLEGRADLFRLGADPDSGAEEGLGEVAPLLQVNVILDNSDRTDRPVVSEPNPTVANLRGTIDREVLAGGRVVSDATHIKAGSILRAHGGFLVIHADDLEGEGQAVWQLIKRTLRTGQLRIETEPGDHSTAKTLRPQAIDVDVKVILIGTPDLYHGLLDADPDFPKLFKVKAEFDSEMELSSQSLHEYACLIRAVCDQDGLPAFDAEGIAAVVEYGVELAGQRNRITTRFSQIEDLVREAAFWASRRDSAFIQSEDVHRALEERRTRLNLAEERTQRTIREGTLFIDTSGERVGQVNGLTVLDTGDYRFGRPARITASVAVGSAGIVNIERRAALSGSYHDKGLLILSGYLQETFARHLPLAVSAAITLEQSYSEIDGDSATLAEVLVLLSALADVPLRQDLAVTGSMNQKGDVQPVGGVNEKVEGFFDLCAARELDGNQGVVLPASNLPNLMLRPDVVDAVREGRFRVWAVGRLEDAVELFTGLPAGTRGADDRFPANTLFGRVERRLDEMARDARDFLPWNG